jgi:CspA family cold shock protein
LRFLCPFLREVFSSANRNREVVQRGEVVRLHCPRRGREDLFVHHSAIVGEGYKSLAENAKVQFDAEQGADGLEAKSVSPTSA